MKTQVLLRLGTLLIAAAGTALAGNATYPLDTGFPQFDPLVGKLQSIGFSLQGMVRQQLDTTDFTTLPAADGTSESDPSSTTTGAVDATPEPVSMALCGLGLVGLSLAARKRGGRR